MVTINCPISRAVRYPPIPSRGIRKMIIRIFTRVPTIELTKVMWVFPSPFIILPKVVAM